jgi:prepilin peptidase CpaA
MQVLLVALVFVFCVAVINGAISDLRTFRIPNWISAVLAVAFVPYAALRWSELPVLQHLGLALVVFILCVVFWRLKWLGGGDVKFLSAISLWMGPANMLPFLIILCLVAAVFSGALMWARRWNFYIQQESRIPAMVKNLVERANHHACPYGFPIAIAAIAMVPQIAG